MQSLAEVERLMGESQEARLADQTSLMSESEPFMSRLARVIDRDWQQNRDNKVKVEQNALECLRERKGEYGPEELALIRSQGQSDIYIKETTGKIRAGIAHIKTILLPSGSTRAHGLKPTTISEVPKFLQKRIVKRIIENPNMVDAEGKPVDPEDQLDMLLSAARREVEAMADRASQNMERKIEDQMEEGGYYRALSNFIESFCTYPAAFFKGPYFSNEPSLSYEMTAEGTVPVMGYRKQMKYRTINFFDAYPAPGVDSCQKGPFIERLRMTKRDLYRMRKMPGYSEDSIEQVMRDSVHGNLGQWLWTDAHRKQIADHSYFWYQSTSDLDGLHWYGSAQGLDLLEWGINPLLIPDPLDYYEVDAIKVGREVVKASLNIDPKVRRPIHSACYERMEGSVFGNSISMLMRSTQRMINATARALQNNQAHASGFQVEVNHKRIAPETDIYDLHPFKVWQTEESEVSTNGAQAVRFFQPNSNAQELMGTIRYFKEVADSDTGIPSVLQGGAGPTEGSAATAKGTGYLLNNAAKLLRYSIGNIDEDVVVPTLEQQFDHNMLYDKDPSIKWDCKVVAKGANEILQRETARQEHMAMLEITNNPVDAKIIGDRGRAYMLKKTLDTFENVDGDQIIPAGEEFEQMMANLANQPQPPNPELIKIEAMAKHNQTMAQIEGAKLDLQEKLQQEKLAAERIMKVMELSTKEKISEDDLAKKVQNEIVKLRATRMSERERMQIDVKLARVKAEQAAKLKILEIREARRVEDKDIDREVTSAIDAHLDKLGDQVDSIKDEIIGAIKAQEVLSKSLL